MLTPLAALALLCALGAGLAWGERSQKGNVIAFLDGRISPRALPRDRLAPLAIHIRGGLQTADGGLLPRATRIELGLPAGGVLSTRGLSSCPSRRLLDERPPEALAACRQALVGRGRLEAWVVVPNQAPFWLRARALAFNGRPGGGRGVILYAYTANPPAVVVLPLHLRRRAGRFSLALVGDLSRALGPWPHLAGFELTLFRRYSYRGESRSYLSASCPTAPRATAGFFSLVRVRFTLADGRSLGTGIARSCRAR